MARINPTPQKPSREAIERAKALTEREKELDRIMPKVTYKTYGCKMCGGAVYDRNKHLEWHTRSDEERIALICADLFPFGGK